jgi:hypothetical protein
MRHLIIVLGILGLLGVTSRSATACSCGGSGSPCEAYGSAAAVFVGTPISARSNEPRSRDQKVDDHLPTTYKFSIEQSYLGVDGTEIEIFTGSGGGDCGYEFKIGERYLVYAYHYEGRLSTSICTRTRPFTRATEDIEFLGNLSSAPAGATIHGQIIHTVMSDKEKPERKPVAPEVFVVIEGEGIKRQVRPDQEGRYRVSGLPAGKFKVAVMLLGTLTTHQPERDVTVANRGCAAVSYYITDNGRVSGRVFDAEGQPVARIMISLVNPDSDPKKDYVQLNRTDESGRFSFSAVPAGRYLIAVNFNRYPKLNDPTLAYPPSFYPGVIDQANAEVITLETGGKLTDLDIRVPLRQPASVLTGRVVWADGSPIAGAALTVIDVTQAESNSGYGVQADEQGRFTINGYLGQKLVLEGRSNRTYVPTGARFEPMERAEKVRLTLKQPAETVKIVITKLR